jgi:hypothetical protein
MIRTSTLLAAAIAAAHLLSGCKDDAGAPAASVTSPVPSAATAAPIVPATAAAAATSAAPLAPTSSAAVKTFDCGGKGEKPCPMQGWMKRVMGPALASEDKEKLSKALLYAAAHVPPGYDGWSAIAKAGADKAKAGDMEGAKVSCKQCHDAYKESYKATLRDRPF